MSRFLVYRSWFVPSFCLFLFYSNLTYCQPESKNGWVLPTEGTIRVLMVFVEVDHDEDPSIDDYPKGHKVWDVNELPAYKDRVFNVFEGEDSLKRLTKYYSECSFGKLTVLGDYFPEIITVKQSEVGRNKSKILKEVVKRINASERISSQNLDFSDFDHWEDATKRGVAKIPSTEFSGVDHLMVFLRNFSAIQSANGQASASSGGNIGGFKTDSYSIFGGGNELPFKIMKHEFNHLLIGGNNLHSGGGNSAGFRSYVFGVQGGWSMMGAANSCLMSPSGWDRYWLGWKPGSNQFEISCRDEDGNEANADLTDESGSQELVLRDFVTTGDALRIRVPFIPEEEFPQWIWVENHTTAAHNGSPTDVFVYEYHDCMDDAQPGLFLTRQIDAHQRQGKKVYSQVYADYLKPIPATGAYDYVWDKDKLQLEACVNNKARYVYSLLPDFENPLTGHHELEEPIYYTNDHVEIRDKNLRSPGIRRNRDGSYYNHPKAGDPTFAMREGKVDFIGIGTNPATASSLTHVNARKGKSSNSQNSDAIYLNGISIKILETLPDLSVKVKVAFNDTLMREDRRWAGSEVVLNNHNHNGSDLYVKSTLTLDRGKTLTRFVNPDTVSGETFFSSPTILRVKSGAKLTIEQDVKVLKDSKIIIEAGGELELLRKARINLENAAEIIFEKGSTFTGKGKLKFHDSSRGSIGDEATLKDVKRRTCQKKRLSLKT